MKRERFHVPQRGQGGSWCGSVHTVVSGDGDLQPRVVSAAGLVGKSRLVVMVRAAVPLLAYLWSP